MVASDNQDITILETINDYFKLEMQSGNDTEYDYISFNLLFLFS